MNNREGEKIEEIQVSKLIMGTERKDYPTTATNSSGNLMGSPEVRESGRQNLEL